MGINYAEKEREFVDALGADTGRDLSEWMHAIDAAGHGHRNDIIDWLRHQGFAFPKASWLERIHHNKGRLIYADDGSLTAKEDSPAREVKRHDKPPAIPPQQIARVEGDVAGVLSTAKGLRPLAELVVREIETAVPGIAIEASPPHIAFKAPQAFAALLPGPKELRLYAVFGTAGDGRAKRAEASQLRGAPPFPEMLILNDARQIDAAFRDLVAAAYMRSLE